MIYIPWKKLQSMSASKLDSSKNPTIMPLLAKELEREIPDVDIHGSERKLLDFAFQDLEICLDSECSKVSFDYIEKALNEEANQDEVKSFLKVWTTRWLEKWRERVTLCQKIPQISVSHIKIKNRAAKVFKQMEKEKELKSLVIQKLINKGEVCMVELIAENLIIEEIAHRLKANNRKEATNWNTLDPLEIFQEVVPRINRLTERKVPIIHLKLMMDL